MIKWANWHQAYKLDICYNIYGYSINFFAFPTKTSRVKGLKRYITGYIHKY